MKNTNAAFKMVIHTYPDVLLCTRKFDCPSNHTSCLLCACYGLGPGTGTVMGKRGNP